MKNLALGTPQRFAVFVIAIVLWLAAWLTYTRHAMLDDALIHLRYADWLYKVHFITYDGAHPSFGASSLLYVGLLAAARTLSASPLLPKVVSVLFYLLLVCFLLAVFRRLRSQAARIVCLGLLFSLLSPMGIRWLTDGMETSLVALMTAVLALLVQREGRGADRGSFLRSFGLCVYGALLVLLRVELASLVVLASAVIFLQRYARVHSRAGVLTAAVRAALPLSAGAVVALGGIRLAFGTVLPDTALAKSGSASLQPLFSVEHVLASSFVLGMGALLVWAASALLVLHRSTGRGRAALWTVLLANTPFVLVLMLACARGQAVQGVRYVLWCFVFSSVWNGLELSQLQQDQEMLKQQGARKITLAAAATWACIALILLPFDWRSAAHTMRGRAATFDKMRSMHLEILRGKRLVAGDVGFIGYFTGGEVCDLDGLVNGRAAARAGDEQRLHRCAQLGPEVLFLTTSQALGLSTVMPLKDWDVCQFLDFTNVRSDDRHYLAVPLEASSRYCQYTGGPLYPLRKVLPE